MRASIIKYCFIWTPKVLGSLTDLRSTSEQFRWALSILSPHRPCTHTQRERVIGWLRTDKPKLHNAFILERIGLLNACYWGPQHWPVMWMPQWNRSWVSDEMLHLPCSCPVRTISFLWVCSNFLGKKPPTSRRCCWEIRCTSSLARDIAGLVQCRKAVEIGAAIRTNTVSCGWQLLNRSMENTTRIFIAVAEIKKCADMGIDIVCVLAMLMCDPVIIFYHFFYLYSSIFKEIRFGLQFRACRLPRLKLCNL